MVYLESKESTDLVKLETTQGDIIVKLNPAVAPLTVNNFKKLVAKKFYDGLIFHRVISGFMVQGGDPTGTGCGGSDEQIKGEFSSNGVTNTLSHTRGVISMARSQMKNSASSQFFICHQNAAFLDGQYASFGEVVQGMETVDKIAAIKTDSGDRPRVNQVMNKVYFVKEK
jgi:peptidyl-prolyl cis-trans isomerase B (cyclophilin B)